MLMQRHLPYIISHASLKHVFGFSFAALFKRLTAAAKNSHPCTLGELQPPLGIQPPLTRAHHTADTPTRLSLLFNHLSCSNHSPDPLWAVDWFISTLLKLFGENSLPSTFFFCFVLTHTHFTQFRVWLCISHSRACTHRLRLLGVEKNKNKTF